MAEAAQPKPTLRQTLRVYLAPASLRMLALGFAAGLPLLLVMGTLSFRLREAGVDRATIGYLGWVGLAYGFKWVWAPLVDRMPLPGLTGWLGRRRGWLLLAQLGVVAGLVGMALADPRQSLAVLVWCALAVALASATQDIALDAYRIESASPELQSALAASYQTGYRLAMIWAGAGALRLAAYAQGTATGYDDAAWQMAYLVMAASMAVGMATVLLSPEPAQSVRGQSEGQALYQRMLGEVAARGVPWLGVAAALAWACWLGWIMAHAAGLNWTQALERHWLDWVGAPAAALDGALNAADKGAPPALADKLRRMGLTATPFLAWAALAVVLSVLAARGVGGRWRPGAGTASQRVLAWAQASFVVPLADFLGRYGRQALLVLALIGVYRISDMVMGNMANPFYVDMGYTKQQVSDVSKLYGLVMTLVGAFLGGSLVLRFGVMRILMLGAALSALTNVLFAWLAGVGHSVPALILVVSADNLASGLASAAFVGYLSSLTNISYSASQYALFSSLMLLGPKFLAGFAGDYVNAFGYPAFFTSTALLGLPVLLLVWAASRAQRGRA